MQIDEWKVVFPFPIKIINLLGGISCLSANDGTCWAMAPGDYGKSWCGLHNDGTYLIKEFGELRPISFHHCDDESDMQQLLVTDHLITKGQSGRSADLEQSERWQGLATAYKKQSNNLRSLRAERIANQIRFCTDLLNELFRSYRNCLTEHANENSINRPAADSYKFKSDKYGIDISYRLQSLLDAIYSLRDYTFTFLFEEMYEIKSKKLFSEATLKILDDDRFNVKSIIAPAISQSDPPGVIARISTYRNVLFHYLGPGSGPMRYCFCINEVNTALGVMPRLIYPLDTNWQRLRAIETGGVTFPQDREEAKRIAIDFMKAHPQIDALEICFECYNILLLILERMAEGTGVASEIIEIPVEDIISATFRQGGETRRFTKNADGRLVEDLSIDKKDE